MSNVDEKTIQKWIKLVDLLDSLTEASKLKWDNGSKINSFITAVGNETILIRTARTEHHPDPDVIVEITDAYGETIDEFSDVDLKPRAESDIYLTMLELHRKISRKVSGADDILDNILSILQKQDDYPF